MDLRLDFFCENAELNIIKDSETDLRFDTLSGT